MLSTEEIKKLTEYQVEVFKDVFATKDDIKEIDGKLNTLQTSVDSLSKDKAANEQERTVGNHRIKELEDWVDKAAPKIGLEFQH